MLRGGDRHRDILIYYEIKTLKILFSGLYESLLCWNIWCVYVTGFLFQLSINFDIFFSF